jgi:general secretion pathway protein I
MRRLNGFTLLEVMVALVIISISLIFISQTMAQYLDDTITLRERTYASWIAQNKIVELRIANVVPEVGITRGDEEYANAVWDWSTEITKIGGDADGTGIENLYRVEVSVFNSGSDDVVRKVSGFIGEPVVPGQSNQAWFALSPGGDENQGAKE